MKAYKKKLGVNWEQEFLDLSRAERKAREHIWAKERTIMTFINVICAVISLCFAVFTFLKVFGIL